MLDVESETQRVMQMFQCFFLYSIINSVIHIYTKALRGQLHGQKSEMAPLPLRGEQRRLIKGYGSPEGRGGEQGLEWPASSAELTRHALFDSIERLELGEPVCRMD